MSLHIRSWSEEEFAEAREPWQELLAESDADPLFMSWDWQWRWWAHHRRSLKAELRVLGAYTDGGRLLAIAPFYSRVVRSVRLLPVRRLELLGSAWRTNGAVFSEYLDLIVARDTRAEVVAEAAAWISQRLEWDDLVISYSKAQSAASSLVGEHLAAVAHARQVDDSVAYSAILPNTFPEYVDALSSNTRRKVLNQRAKLRSPEVVAAGAGDIEKFLDLLLRFNASRWQSRSGTAHDGFRRFHNDFAACMARTGALRLTMLREEGRPVSMMYNVRVAGAEYYLQSGFDPDMARGRSPGYLHFGYALEGACADGVEKFDMLCGRGRHREYKPDLATEQVNLACYQAIRAPLLRLLYSSRDRLRSGVVDSRTTS